MKTILIIEDDNDINHILNELLTTNGYQCISAFSGTEGLLLVEKETIDLILLDLMLPGKNGSEVLETIRKTKKVPIIALTAISDINSKVNLLKLGADDYITKPFDHAELLARIEVQLRKEDSPTDSSLLVYKDISLDYNAYSVAVGGIPLIFSRKEFEILKLLMTYPSKVFSKENIYESVWGDDYIGDDNTIAVHISNIRNKLSQLNPNEEYVQTIWGIGFKMS